MIKIFCFICGMKIDSRSVFLNESAILEKNSLEDISSCPFCGASKDYFGNAPVKLELDSLSEAEKVILDHAMKLEVFNGEFYKEASKMSRDKTNEDLFIALSNIEMMHANIHRRLLGFEELPKLVKVDYSRYGNDLELLEAAGKREEHAVAYYKKYMDAIENEKIKNVFKALSEIESQHITLLKLSV